MIFAARQQRDHYFPHIIFRWFELQLILRPVIERPGKNNMIGATVMNMELNCFFTLVNVRRLMLSHNSLLSFEWRDKYIFLFYRVVVSTRVWERGQLYK